MQAYGFILAIIINLCFPCSRLLKDQVDVDVCLDFLTIFYSHISQF